MCTPKMKTKKVEAKQAPLKPDPMGPSFEEMMDFAMDEEAMDF